MVFDESTQVEILCVCVCVCVCISDLISWWNYVRNGSLDGAINESMIQRISG